MSLFGGPLSLPLPLASNGDAPTPTPTPTGGLVVEIMDLQKRLRHGLQKRKRNFSPEEEEEEAPEVQAVQAVQAGDLADDEGAAVSSSSLLDRERTKRRRLGSPPPPSPTGTGPPLSRSPYVRPFTFGRMLKNVEGKSETEKTESEGAPLSLDDYIQSNDYGSHYEEDDTNTREDEEDEKEPSYDPYAHYSREEPFVEDEPEEGEERDEHEIGNKDTTQKRAVRRPFRARVHNPPQAFRSFERYSSTCPPPPPPPPAACLCHCQTHPAAASHAHCAYPPSPTASERFLPMSAPSRVPVKLRLGFAPETHQRRGNVKERLGRRSVHDRLGWPFN